MKDQVDGEMEEMEKSLPGTPGLPPAGSLQHLDTLVLVAHKGRKCPLFLSHQPEVKTNKVCHNSHSHLFNQWEAKMNSRILNKIYHPILNFHFLQWVAKVGRIPFHSQLSLQLAISKESNKTCHHFNS